MLWAQKVFTAQHTTGKFIPTHGMLVPKMGLEVCLFVKAICTAVYSVAVPDVIRARKGIGFFQGDGFLLGIGSLRSISSLLGTC